MKTQQLRGFLEEFLSSQGANTERGGENLLIVHPPRRLMPALGTKELVLAFNLRGLQEDPRSELGTVGNPVFDRILELARQTGRVGERFEPAGALPKKLAGPQEHFRFLSPGMKTSEGAATYAPLYFLVFRIEYSLEEQADELEVVPVDGVSLQTLAQMPELAEQWERLEREPAAGRVPQAPFPVPPEVLRAGLRLLEKRLRKRLGRVRRDSEEHLAREAESIGNYYRQLIEETRNAGRRWALPAGGREERIRVLQLDWKRRVEEAQQSWRPHLDVRLTGVGAVQRPRVGFRVMGADAPSRSSGARAAAKRNFMLFWDEIDRRFVDPPCRRCGTPGQIELALGEEGFLCARCFRLVSERPDKEKVASGSRH